MSVGYEQPPPGDVLVDEDEVNRRRAGRLPGAPKRRRRGRRRLAEPPAPEPGRAAADDPRWALCSNAALLDQHDPDNDAGVPADVVLDHYASTPPLASDTKAESASAHEGFDERDEIREHIAGLHQRPAPVVAAGPRGTAELDRSDRGPRRPSDFRLRVARGERRSRRSARRRTWAGAVAGVAVLGGAAGIGLLNGGGASRPLSIDHPALSAGLEASADADGHSIVAQLRAATAARAEVADAITGRDAGRRGATHGQTGRRRSVSRGHRVPRASGSSSTQTARTVQVTRTITTTPAQAPQTTSVAQTPPASTTASGAAQSTGPSQQPAFGSDGALGAGRSPDS